MPSLFLRQFLWIAVISFVGILHVFLASQAIQASVENDARPGRYNNEEVSWVVNRQLTEPLALKRNKNLDFKPPTQIVVIGENESDSRFAADVLKNAFGNGSTHLHRSLHRRNLLDDAELRDISSKTDILWVITVRSPCLWTDTIVQSQKLSCENEELSGDLCQAIATGSDENYHRIPWQDSDVHEVHDRNNVIIIQNTLEQKLSYHDIFDMRRQKLLLLKQIVDVMSRHTKILRVGEFELDPHAFVNDLVTEYKFKTRDQYELSLSEMHSRKQSSFSCMEYSKWSDFQQGLDWTLEGYFGHTRLDCHLCRIGSTQELTTSLTNRIYLLGERNSGTTFVSNTLANAFDPPNTMGSDAEKFASDIPILLHKHMFRHDVLNSSEIADISAMDDVLWILVVRSPCEWAEAMFRKPYHLCPPNQPNKCGPNSKAIWLNQNTVARMSLLHFLTEMEWGDWPESAPFLRDSGHESRESKGSKDKVSISKVSTNYTYPNVFELRRHKLQIMKQIIETTRNVKLVRLNEVERSPEIFIQDLIREFDLTVKDDYKPQKKSPITHKTVCLTREEWDAAQMTIDWNLEAEFGFSPVDCRMCYGYDKSTSLFVRVEKGKKIKKIIKDYAKE